jgi:RNA polymerase sigma factor (sigma-70 family)
MTVRSWIPNTLDRLPTSLALASSVRVIGRAGRVDDRTHADVAEFWLIHQAKLSRLALVLAGERTTAEDLVQDTMVKVIRSWRKVRSTDQPLAYASRVMINQWRDSTRTLARRRSNENAGASMDAEESSVHEPQILDRITLEDAMTHLTAKQRLVVYFRYFEDLPVRDVAQLLGCSEGNVKSQTSAALQRLASSLHLSPADTRGESQYGHE